MKIKEEKELLFSVTANDCEWSYTKGSGAGGQKRNKTSSAVHCNHRPSGAHGYSEKSRSQHENKIDAFLKMIETKEFKKWHRLEIMRKNGQIIDIENQVKKELKNVKIEIRKDNKWIQIDKNLELPD